MLDTSQRDFHFRRQRTRGHLSRVRHTLAHWDRYQDESVMTRDELQSIEMLLTEHLRELEGTVVRSVQA